jgi:hypothetical protein
MSGWPMAGLHPPSVSGRRPYSAPDGQCRISTRPPAEHAAVKVHGVNSGRGSCRGSGRIQWQRQWTATASSRAREHDPDHPLGLSSRQVMARTSSKVASTVAVPRSSMTPAAPPAIPGRERPGGGHAAVAPPARCPGRCHGRSPLTLTLPLKLSLRQSLKLNPGTETETETETGRIRCLNPMQFRMSRTLFTTRPGI